MEYSLQVKDKPIFIMITLSYMQNFVLVCYRNSCQMPKVSFLGGKKTFMHPIISKMRDLGFQWFQYSAHPYVYVCCIEHFFIIHR